MWITLISYAYITAFFWVKIFDVLHVSHAALFTMVANKHRLYSHVLRLIWVSCSQKYASILCSRLVVPENETQLKKKLALLSNMDPPRLRFYNCNFD